MVEPSEGVCFGGEEEKIVWRSQRLSKVLRSRRVVAGAQPDDLDVQFLQPLHIMGGVACFLTGL